MSVKILSKAWELELPRGEKFLLLALADHAHDDGTKCFPGLAYLCWKTGYKERQAQRILRTLENKKIIVPVAHAKGGRGMATEYCIHLEKGVKMAPYRNYNSRSGFQQRVSSATEKGVTSDTPSVINRHEPGDPRSVGCRGQLERAGENRANSLSGLGTEKSSADKRTPEVDWQFRKHLEAGVFRKKVYAAYFDMLQSTRDETRAIREAVMEAALSLCCNRGAAELRAIDHKQLAEAAWNRIQSHVKTLTQILNFDRRKNLIVGSAVNSVVDAALELKAGTPLNR